METLFQNKFSSLTYNENHNILIQTWSDDRQMEAHNYTEEMFNFLEVIEEKKCKKVLINAQKLRFFIDSKCQQWTDENFIKKTVNIIEYLSIVAPEELYAKLSLFQTMGGKSIKKYTNLHYHISEANAKDWLIEQ